MKREEMRRIVDEMVDFISARERTAQAALEEVADRLVNVLAPAEARATFDSGRCDHPAYEELMRVAETSLTIGRATLERLFWVGIYNEVFAGEAWRQVPLSKKYALIELRDRARLSDGVRLALRGKISVRQVAAWVSDRNRALEGAREPRIGTRNVGQMVRVGSILDGRDRLDRLADSIAELPDDERDRIERGLEQTAAGAKKLLAAVRKKRRDRG